MAKEEGKEGLNVPEEALLSLWTVARSTVVDLSRHCLGVLINPSAAPYHTPKLQILRSASHALGLENVSEFS
jgi:hypothetical protein